MKKISMTMRMMKQSARLIARRFLFPKALRMMSLGVAKRTVRRIGTKPTKSPRRISRKTPILVMTSASNLPLLLLSRWL
jgi:hypothetical protein